MEGMALSMPITRVVFPSSVVNQPNGAVNPALLTWVESGRTGLTWLMAQLPARAMRAWHADAAKRGIKLGSTGRGRTLAQQWDIFGGAHRRYEPCSSLQYMAAAVYGRAKRWSDADRRAVATRLGINIPASTYWRKIRYSDGSYPATAAVPGTSNHGKWCADDLAETVNGVLVPLRPSTIQYLYATGRSFGFTWENTEEPWHVAWANGDVVPQAVIDFEHPPPPPPPVGFDPAHGAWGLWPLGLNKPVLRQGSKGDAVRYLQGVILLKAGGRIAVDGDFGPQTQARVLDLQRFFKLTVDGVVGPQTWEVVDHLATL